MNRGCLTLFGLGLLSLFVFGVTLEALNDPKELSAIPFNPWDFLTYGLIALGILLLIRIAALAESSFPVHWIKHPKVNAKAWLLVAAAMVLPVIFALSLPRSKSYRAVAEDPAMGAFHYLMSQTLMSMYEAYMLVPPPPSRLCRR
jgi:hypothetical protein